MKSKILTTIGFLCVLTIAFYIGQYSTKKERDLNAANLRASQDSVRHLVITLNGILIQLAERDAIILTQKEAIASGILERDRLKALHIKEVITNTELEGVIKILRDSLKLPPGTEFIVIKDTTGITKEYVRFPFTLIEEKSEFINLSAGMRKNKTAWFDLSIPLTGEMTIGYQRAGLFKVKPIGIFTSENPYLRINNMNILIVKEEKKWFQQWWVHFLAGAVAIETIHVITK